MIFIPHVAANQSNQNASVSCIALLEPFELNHRLLTEMSLYSAEYEDRNETMEKLIRQTIPLEKQWLLALKKTNDLSLLRAYLRLEIIGQKKLLVVMELPALDHEKLQDIAAKVDDCHLI